MSSYMSTPPGPKDNTDWLVNLNLNSGFHSTGKFELLRKPSIALYRKYLFYCGLFDVCLFAFFLLLRLMSCLIATLLSNLIKQVTLAGRAT